MNPDEKQTGFDFGLNDEATENIYGAEIAHQRVEKLSIRLTLISVLIPCVIGVILLLAYFDVKKKYDSLNSQGAQVAQNLSKDLETTYSTLSVQVAKLEKTLKDQMDTANDSIKAQEKAFLETKKNNQKSLNQKVDKKDVKALKLTIDANFKKIGQGLTQLAETNRKIENRFSQELVMANQTIAELQTENEQLRKKIVELEDVKTKLDELEKTTRQEDDRLAESLIKMRQQVADRISDSEKQIEDLNVRTGALEKSPPSASREKSKPIHSSQPKAAKEPIKSPSSAPVKKSPEPASTSASPDKKETAPEPLPLPAPGKIIEQDIQ